jgi:hypothetical protein
MRLLEQAVGTAFRGDLRDEQRGPALPRSWPEPWPVSNSIS